MRLYRLHRNLFGVAAAFATTAVASGLAWAVGVIPAQAGIMGVCCGLALAIMSLPPKS